MRDRGELHKDDIQFYKEKYLSINGNNNCNEEDDMRNARKWTKKAGSIALGLMVLLPAASYADDLTLPQARWETRASEQEGYGSSHRYREQEERRAQERKMEQKRERESGLSNHDRQGRYESGVGAFGGNGGGRSRGRGR